MVAKVVCCRSCGSDQIVRNGSNRIGNPKYKCKACGHGGVFETRRKSDGEKELAVKAVMERSSLRGVGRIFGVAHATVGKWVKKKPNPHRK